jgi:integrase
MTNIGTPISPRNRLRHFKDKLTRIGLPNIHFHDRRHTTASLLLEKNVQPKIVSELLGHSNAHITLNVYSHIINPINKVASSEIEEMFKV